MQAKKLLNLLSDRITTLPLMVLYITDGCNSRCVTCDIWKNPRRNMSMALVDELVLTCEKLQVQWVLLSGGEAMQHPQWSEIATRFRAAGVRVMMLTNGLLVQKQVAAVVETIDDLIVSLDGGTAEIYHAIRGVDAFDLVIDGIRAVRERGVHVTTRTTVQRANFRELSQIVEVSLAADVNAISFFPVDVSNPYAFGDRFESDTAIEILPQADASHSNALTLEETAELSDILDEMGTRFADAFASGRIAESPDKLRRILVNYFRALLGEETFPRPRCNAPHISTVIEVDGTLRPCYFLPAYGRLKADGAVRLPQAVNVESAQTLRKAYRRGERAECARCVCPLYKGPRSLLRM